MYMCGLLHYTSGLSAGFARRSEWPEKLELAVALAEENPIQLSAE